MKYHVPDMSCGHCKASIESAIATLDPGAAVDIDLDAKTVEVTTAKAPDAVVKKLAEIGFPARPV